MTSNMRIAVDTAAKVVTITIDYSVGGNPSASGKSIVFASTEGNQKIEDELVLGLNLYRKREPEGSSPERGVIPPPG